MSKYTITLTEAEAKALVSLTEDSIVSRMLKQNILKALLRIINKIEIHNHHLNSSELWLWTDVYINWNSLQ